MARKGTMYDKEIASDYLHETITLKIFEPEKFDSLYETNLCIMLDGNDYYQMGRVATLSDKFHDDYDIVNTYFVGIHYIDRFDRVRKFHPSGEQYTAYKQFLALEVVPFLEDLLPINPLGTTVTLMGDSLAGTISLMTALDYPDIVDQLVLQSPLVSEEVLTEVKNYEQAKQFEIYHSIGLQEAKVKTTANEEVDFIIPNQQLAELLKEKFHRYHYHEIAEGNHTWRYWQQELPDVLKLMLG